MCGCKERCHLLTVGVDHSLPLNEIAQYVCRLRLQECSARAFFQRRIDVNGDTVAILALHNALEASELTMADILGLPRQLDPLLQTALSIAGHWRPGEAYP